MARKVKKAERLAQLSAEIKRCEKMCQQYPDPTAESRVNAIIKNPCLSGMFYLNAIFKNSKEEWSESAALKYRSTNRVDYEFEEPTIEGWVVVEGGFFESDNLIGPINSIAGLESAAKSAETEDRKVNDGITIYLNADALLQYAADMAMGELEDANAEAAEDEDSPSYKVFNTSLIGPFGKFYYPTIKVLKSVKNPATITTGIEGVPKCERLFIWSKFSKFCETQKQFANGDEKTPKENRIDNEQLEKIAPYLFRWQFEVTTGPERVKEEVTFKNLSKNEFYPILQAELKSMEKGNGVTGLDGSNPCPRFFEERKTEEELGAEGALSDPMDMEAAMNSDEFKQEYIAAGGIWVSDGDSPIPTSEGGNSTNKYSDLAQSVLDKMNEKQTASELSGYEYDEETGEYIVNKTENPNWPYKALYIDTINYNYWEDLRDQLQVLYQKYSSLPDEQPETDERDPKQKDGKEYKPYCDKYFPLDYTKMLGMSLPTLPFFNVDELLFNAKGEPIMETKFNPKAAITNQPWFTNVQKKETHPVAIIDGYGYVSTGIVLKMEYTGIPLGKYVTLIPGVGLDYGTVLGGYYRPSTNEDLTNMKKFPYLNDQPDGKWFWLQCSFANPAKAISNVQTILTDIGNYEPYIVEFEVFQKFYLECGFPKKCGELTTEELERNGKCGLEQFLTKPIVIDRRGFDPNKFVNKTPDLTISLNQWKKDLSQKLEDSWDFASNLAQNTWNKTVALENFMDIATQMFPAMSFLPTGCMQTVCEAQRKAKGMNSVKDMSDSVKNSVTASQLLAKDMIKNAKDSVSKIADGVGDFFSQATDAAKNLVSTFNVYQLCPRRFNDWLKDAASAMGAPPGIDIFTQLQNTFTNGIMGGFNQLLNNCVTKNLTEKAVAATKDVIASEKQQILGSLKSRKFHRNETFIARFWIKN
jgi:hypothetical protein